jgi:hypothetical protein
MESVLDGTFWNKKLQEYEAVVSRNACSPAAWNTMLSVKNMFAAAILGFRY